MIGASVRRGLAAGLIAGVVAGLFGLIAGEPAIDAAIAIEEAAEGGAAAGHGEPEGFIVTRGAQRAGLVAGTALYGLGFGALFGVAGAWAAGRVQGDAWERSVKLGLVAVAALVLLPALAYPPNPPAVGDPATVGTRTALYLGLGVCGLLLAAAAWTGARQLAQTSLSRPVRQSLIGAGVAAVVALMLALLPEVGGAPDGFPPELLWRFRLASVALQGVLFLGTAVVYGLFASRRTRTPIPSG